MFAHNNCFLFFLRVPLQILLILQGGKRLFWQWTESPSEDAREILEALFCTKPTSCFSAARNARKTWRLDRSKAVTCPSHSNSFSFPLCSLLSLSLSLSHTHTHTHTHLHTAQHALLYTLTHHTNLYATLHSTHYSTQHKYSHNALYTCVSLAPVSCRWKQHRWLCQRSTKQAILWGFLVSLRFVPTRTGPIAWICLVEIFSFNALCEIPL